MPQVRIEIGKDRNDLNTWHNAFWTEFRWIKRNPPSKATTRLPALWTDECSSHERLNSMWKHFPFHSTRMLETIANESKKTLNYYQSQLVTVRKDCILIITAAGDKSEKPIKIEYYWKRFKNTKSFKRDDKSCTLECEGQININNSLCLRQRQKRMSLQRASASFVTTRSQTSSFIVTLEFSQLYCVRTRFSYS